MVDLINRENRVKNKRSSMCMSCCRICVWAHSKVNVVRHILYIELHYKRQLVRFNFMEKKNVFSDYQES